MAQLTKEDFTVGWVSALPRESRAAGAFFVERYDGIQGVRNPAFSYGKIGQNNVVAICLPSMGISQASQQIERLRRHFPQIQYIFLVGIAGGIPRAHGGDVRLGDVVVSTPGKNKVPQSRPSDDDRSTGATTRVYEHSGVERYDFGTQLQDRQELVRRPTAIGRPAEDLVQLVNRVHNDTDLRGDGSSLGDAIEREIAKIAAVHRDLPGTVRPIGPKADHLYKASHPHYDDEYYCDIAGCDDDGVQDSDKFEHRDAQKRVPQVHKGLILSGDRVIRDAYERDRLGRETGGLCVEMEAGGLNAEYKWLVVRGICDYCDSHKNKVWQDYAAMVAAAYTRLLLGSLPLLATEKPDSNDKKPQNVATYYSRTNNRVGSITSNGAPIFNGTSFMGGGTFNFSSRGN